MKIFSSLIVTLLASSPAARAALPACQGPSATWQGSVELDEGCASHRSFTSHDLGPICLLNPGQLSAGAYAIQGAVCEGQWLYVIQARPVFLRH